MRPRTRVLILIGVVLVGATLAFAGARPQGFLAVADVAARDGEVVQMKGTVVEGTLDRTDEAPAFVLSDGLDEIVVRWDPARPLPDPEGGGTIEGRNVVVTGVVVLDESGAHLLASEMQVGCASKYQAA